MLPLGEPVFPVLLHVYTAGAPWRIRLRAAVNLMVNPAAAGSSFNENGGFCLKAIILSAGQGKRLLPLTRNTPKCLLEVAGKTMLEWQVDTLLDVGIEDIVVVTGYGADKVSSLVERRYGKNRVRPLYNPEYATSDNLVSCWKAAGEMREEFLLMNGDTLFDRAVLVRVLNCEPAAMTVTVNSKKSYDADDMKVQCEGRRLLRIGKELPLDSVDGEAIGIIRFLDDGPEIFRKGLEDAIADPGSAGKWYLSVIDSLAARHRIMTCSITGLPWCEVDFEKDLELAVGVVGG